MVFPPSLRSKDYNFDKALNSVFISSQCFSSSKVTPVDSQQRDNLDKFCNLKEVLTRETKPSFPIGQCPQSTVRFYNSAHFSNVSDKLTASAGLIPDLWKLSIILFTAFKFSSKRVSPNTIIGVFIPTAFPTTSFALSMRLPNFPASPPDFSSASPPPNAAAALPKTFDKSSQHNSILVNPFKFSVANRGKAFSNPDPDNFSFLERFSYKLFIYLKLDISVIISISFASSKLTDLAV